MSALHATQARIESHGSLDDRIAGAIWYYLYGHPASLHTLLPAEDRDLLDHTTIRVVPHATAADLRSVAAPTGAALLGLYTFPAPLIQVFVDDIESVGMEPIDVLDHELGHRFGFDHSTHPVATALYAHGDHVDCSSYHSEAAATVVMPDGADTADLDHDDSTCPLCRLHNQTAEVRGLLDGLRRRAWLAAQPASLPLGLGGTIPLVRRKIAQAQATLVEVATVMPDRTGEVRDCDRLLGATQAALVGHVDTDAVTPAAELAERAWDAAYSINHAYWLHLLHPTVTDIHDVL